MSPLRCLLPAVVLLAGCGGAEVKNDTSGGSGGDECGDPDGTGGDTGDVPNVLGLWTATFGANLYDDYMCDPEHISGLTVDDFKWITGNMEIKGRIPDNLYAIFDNNEDERFMGVENASGGIVFTGTHEMSGHMVYVSVGGNLFRVPQVDRDQISGFGYMGVDKDGEDTVIDCWLQGDFVAKKSGN